MSTERDPPRLSRGGEGVPPALSRALGAARARLPGDAVLSAVAARLPSGPPGGGPEGGGPKGDGGSGGTGATRQGLGGSSGGGPLAGPGAPLAAASSVWSGVFAGVALGVLVGGASLFVPMGSPTPSGPVAAPSASISLGATSKRAPAAHDPAPVTSADARPADKPAGTSAPVASAPPGAPPDSPSAAPAEGASPTPAESPSASPAETEADYLRRAHAQMASSPSQALALAEAHPLRYPDGKLGQEREIIVVGALAALGRTSEAQARARRFLARFPDSAFRRRLEVMVPGLADPER